MRVTHRHIAADLSSLYIDAGINHCLRNPLYHSFSLDENGPYGFQLGWLLYRFGPIRKESVGTELAPPDPIFHPSICKNNCLPMFDHKRFQICPHTAVKALYTYQSTFSIWRAKLWGIWSRMVEWSTLTRIAKNFICGRLLAFLNVIMELTITIYSRIAHP